MSLSEAASLYLTDIDILEEARTELDEHFEAAWKVMLEKLGATQKLAFEHSGRAWPGWNQNSGLYGRSTLFAANGTMLKLGVCDPFVSDEPKAFAVYCWCNAGEKKRLEKANGLSVVIDAAARRGLTLDFADVNELGWKYVYTNDEPEMLGATLAAVLREFADHAAALQAEIDRIAPTATATANVE